MTKISNLYALTNYISANSSGNVVIAAPSSGYALDVTGTGRFTGLLTLSGNAATSSAAVFNNAAGSSGTAQWYADFTAGATVIGRILRGNGAAGYEGNGLNFENYAGMLIKLNSLGGSGGGLTVVGGATTLGAALYGTSAIFSSTVQIGNNQATITPTSMGYGSSYKVLAIGTGVSNTSVSLNYDPSGNAGGEFNGTGQIFIAHNKGILAPNAANTNYIAVLRPVGTGVYFGGGMASGEVTGNGLFVATSGNVGIGTTSPNGKLDITVLSGDNNQVRLSAASNIYKDLQWKNSDDGKMWIWSKRVASDGDGFAAWYYNGTTYNSAPNLMLTTSGYVGIGTTSPGALLEINGGGYGTSLLIKTSSLNGADLTLQNTGTGGKRWDITSGGSNNAIGAGGLQFYNETDNVMRMGITSGGAVIINTTSASGQSQFQVNGNIETRGNSTILMLSNTGGTAQSWWVGQDTAGTNDGIFYIYNQTSSTQAINIRKNNNVLIGTQTDIGAKLHVNGNIIASGGGGSNGLLSRENTSASTYGFFNAGNSSLVLTNSGVANVGYFAISSGNYVATSDRNKKKDFEPSNYGLNEVLQLIPTLYRFKTEESDSQKHIGFIAQDVKDIIPAAYKESNIGDETFIGLENTAFIPVLVKAIQELSAKVTALENK